MNQNNNIEIILDEKGDKDIEKTLIDGLKAFNESIVGPYSRQNFQYYLKTTDNHIIGGITGGIRQDQCFIDIFWVDEKYRHRGFGKKLLTKTEKYVKEKGCQYIMLHTAEFQNKDFYLHHGFNIITTIPVGFMGYDAYIMKKEL